MAADLTMRRALADSWTEVLGRAPTGDSANFFEDGGDSLGALQLVEIVESKGFSVDLGRVFAGGSLADILQSMRAL